MAMPMGAPLDANDAAVIEMLADKAGRSFLSLLAICQSGGFANFHDALRYTHSNDPFFAFFEAALSRAGTALEEWPKLADLIQRWHASALAEYLGGAA